MRDQVRSLVRLGPLPDDERADVGWLKEFGDLLNGIEPPLTAEEAQTLLGLFGPDDCYGLPWSLLHLIESAPYSAIEDRLRDSRNRWEELLRQRAENAGTGAENGAEQSR
jgi:hypothetical protein